jgi:hypothetical protein
LLEIEQVIPSEGIEIKFAKKKSQIKISALTEFSKLSDYEKILANKVPTDQRNAWFWNAFRKIDEEVRYFKY